ncbi:FtsH protease activity modulator HflK [Fuerstiella marisgermanici]|uniref:Protein HflK n=1 Tax=Fuerstiella marisgermanici TaxID=1891926 RepID=A0A1P8WA15_9PLAN|nr:FtsH protease activity modulator HflK [Fuerstiella marisgermanici]APZ90897.1 Modulator of FtsH protease HflK [Fuerstiella marisgermanici]
MAPNEIQIEFRREDVVKATKLIVGGFLLLAVILLVTRSMYTVQPSEQAVVLRFGKYHSTSVMGLHFCIPFVDEVLKVEVRERTLRLPFGVEGEDRPVAVKEEDVLMLTGDLNAAVVEWALQWQVADPQKYLFTFHRDQVDQDQFLQYIITAVSRTVMNRLVGDYSIGEVLTSKREEISFKATEATQQLLDRYDCGIRVTNLQLQRVLPPEQVRASYAAINEADQTRDKLENEAQKEKNTLLPQAQAERDKAIREAEGYAARRRSEVKGEIDALMVQYEQFAKAPEETRQRLYLEALEKVMSNVENKTIIDSDLQQLLPLLNLSEGSK